MCACVHEGMCCVTHIVQSSIVQSPRNPNSPPKQTSPRTDGGDDADADGSGGDDHNLGAEAFKLHAPPRPGRRGQLQPVQPHEGGGGEALVLFLLPLVDTPPHPLVPHALADKEDGRRAAAVAARALIPALVLGLLLPLLVIVGLGGADVGAVARVDVQERVAVVLFLLSK